ncbi:hypothetical protein ABK040_016206 [Willaertia magna]
MDLLLLQELIYKDPKAYHDDYLLQLKHLNNQIEITKLKPLEENKYFIKLLQFMSITCKLFKNEIKNSATKLIECLETKATELNPKIRRQITGTCIAFRNNDIIDSKTLIPILFKLFRVHDKVLRRSIYKHIISDISKINLKKRNVAVNKSLQNFVFSMLKDSFRIAAKKSLQILIHLYRRNIWNDERCVNVIAQACFMEDTALVVIALKFFLGEIIEEEDDDEEEQQSKKKNKQKEKDRSIDSLKKELKFKITNLHSKKTKKKQNKLKKAMKQLDKKEKKKENQNQLDSINCLNLLNDPQSFCEKLFNKLKTSNDKFEVRILMMDVISRCIASNQLLVLNFYPFVQKYLQPAQLNVTKILAVTAQSIHALVPPDVIHPLVMTIANNFANDHSRPNVIAAGLNTIRVICSRQPLVMTKTLLRDLAMYAKYKDKTVFHAARGLITLFRELSPKMLHKKNRGKDHDMTAELKEYGEQEISEGVDGIELLEEYLQRKESEKGLMNLDEEDDSDEDGEWIDVEDEDGKKEMKEILKQLEQDSDDEEEENNEENEEEETNEEVIELEELEDDENTMQEDSDDENNEEEEEQEEEKPKYNVAALSSQRVLTQEDFELIAKLKKKKELEKQLGVDKKRKRKENDEGVVDEDDIGDVVVETDDEEDDKEKPEKKKWKKNWDQGSTTNKQKKKHKPFAMLKNSREIRHKAVMGQSEKRYKKKISDRRNLKHKLKHR